MRVLPVRRPRLLLECGGTDRGAGGVRRGAGVAARPASSTCTDIVPAARDPAARRPGRPGRCSPGIDGLARRAARGRGGRAGRAAGDLRRSRPRVGGRAQRARRSRRSCGGTGRRSSWWPSAGSRRVSPTSAGCRRSSRCPGWTSRGPRCRRVGRAGRHVHRGLPAVLAGRVAADRPHRGDAVGRRPGPAGAAVARHPGAVHRWLTEDDEPRALGGHRTPAPRSPCRTSAARAGPPRRPAFGRPGRPRRTAWPTGWWATTSRRRRWSASAGSCPSAPGRAVTVAVTGAACRSRVDGRGPRLGQRGGGARRGRWWSWVTVTAGLRAYLAVSGGIEVEPVLGSRSTDLLSGLGPEPVASGDVLPVGRRRARRCRSRRCARLGRPASCGCGWVRARTGSRPTAVEALGRVVVRRGQRVEPDRAAPRGRADPLEAEGGAAERGDGAGRGAGAAQRAAGGLPARPSDDRWLPRGRGRRTRRPGRLRPAAAGRARSLFGWSERRQRGVGDRRS